MTCQEFNLKGQADKLAPTSRRGHRGNILQPESAHMGLAMQVKLHPKAGVLTISHRELARSVAHDSSCTFPSKVSMTANLHSGGLGIRRSIAGHILPRLRPDNRCHLQRFAS